MNPVRRIRRIAALLGSLAVGLVAFATPAFARPAPPPGTEFRSSAPAPAVSAVTHIVVTGGMPGWQIALIAIGAALLTATAGVLADRAWTARRRPTAASA
jgi:hypothetical protein